MDREELKSPGERGYLTKRKPVVAGLTSSLPVYCRHVVPVPLFL